MAGVGHLQARQLLEVAVHLFGETPEKARPVGRSHLPPGGKGRCRPGDGHVGFLLRGQRNGSNDLFGGRVEDSAHSLSNPRNRSQSVTAASKLSTSTLAMFT